MIDVAPSCAMQVYGVGIVEVVCTYEALQDVVVSKRDERVRLRE